MLESVKKEANYEDLESLPENTTGEIIDGELYALPRPSFRHGRSASGIGGEIWGPYDIGRGGPGGWWILDEPEIRFSSAKKDTVVPDLAGWRKEKMPKFPITNWTSIPPDWICEVLSPKTATHDRKRKMPKYAKYGVSYLWIVHPIDRTVEIFKLEVNRYVVLDVFGEDDKMRAEPFSEVEINLKNLWINVEGEDE